MVLKTDRLILRNMGQEDYEALCRILKDNDVMYAYEGAFSDREVQEWLDRQTERYHQYGFGLWAVTLKDSGRMIGQCGLTMQDYREKQVLEVGYLFEKAYWHHGYAVEAAAASHKTPQQQRCMEPIGKRKLLKPVLDSLFVYFQF